jgi:hypothetical protein
MSSISRSQLLALGIGHPQELTQEELQEFFRVVYPVEAQHQIPKQLVKEAHKYLSAAKPSNFAKNADLLVERGIPRRLVVKTLRDQTKKYEDAIENHKLSISELFRVIGQILPNSKQTQLFVTCLARQTQQKKSWGTNALILGAQL